MVSVIDDNPPPYVQLAARGAGCLRVHGGIFQHLIKLVDRAEVARRYSHIILRARPFSDQIAEKDVSPVRYVNMRYVIHLDVVNLVLGMKELGYVALLRRNRTSRAEHTKQDHLSKDHETKQAQHDVPVIGALTMHGVPYSPNRTGSPMARAVRY